MPEQLATNKEMNEATVEALKKLDLSNITAAYKPLSKYEVEPKGKPAVQVTIPIKKEVDPLFQLSMISAIVEADPKMEVHYAGETWTKDKKEIRLRVVPEGKAEKISADKLPEAIKLQVVKALDSYLKGTTEKQEERFEEAASKLQVSYAQHRYAESKKSNKQR